jgi:hypothetical protein
MEQTMNRHRIAILNEQFRTDTEQGINAALAQGVNPWAEYLATLGDLAAQTADCLPSFQGIPRN